MVCTCIQCMEASLFILPHCILFKLFEQSGDEEGGRVPQTESKKEGGVGREGEMACYCSSKHMHLRLPTCWRTVGIIVLAYRVNISLTSSLPNKVLTENEGVLDVDTI